MIKLKNSAEMLYEDLRHMKDWTLDQEKNADRNSTEMIDDARAGLQRILRIYFDSDEAII